MAPAGGCGSPLLPFLNRTSHENAGEVLALEFLGELAGSDRFEVVDPGVVRSVLLERRIVIRGGISFDEATSMLDTLDADVVLSGEVRDFEQVAGEHGLSRGRVHRPADRPRSRTSSGNRCRRTPARMPSGCSTSGQCARRPGSRAGWLRGSWRHGEAPADRSATFKAPGSRAAWSATEGHSCDAVFAGPPASGSGALRPAIRSTQALRAGLSNRSLRHLDSCQKRGVARHGRCNFDEDMRLSPLRHHPSHLLASLS